MLFGGASAPHGDTYRRKFGKQRCTARGSLARCCASSGYLFDAAYCRLRAPSAGDAGVMAKLG